MEILEVKENILKNNDKDADLLRKELSEKKVFYLNIMSSPGSGKTTTLAAVIRKLRNSFKIGVMEADIDSSVDAETIAKEGVSVVQLHTGGMCHLSADMSRQGLEKLNIENLDIVFLENVGNLVCPAEFDTGAHKNICILSVPEGDDKPLKYPLMFRTCDLVLINKIDAARAFDFDMDKAAGYIKMRNPNAAVIPISSLTGEGIDNVCGWITRQMNAVPAEGVVSDENN